MRAVLFPGDRKVVHCEFADPKPGPGQVVVRMKASGLCGSELHGIYQRSRESKRGTLLEGIIPGHEPAGVVEEIGPGVTAVKPGDRVMIYHIRGCGNCKYCRAGWMLHCPVAKRSYGWDAHGGHADFILVDERNCVIMPPALSFIDGAHCACGGGTAYQALLRLGISGRDRMAMFGMGPVGLGGLILAKAMGATVYAVEVTPERLELAKKLGADAAINPTTEDAVKAIRELTDGEGAEAAVDWSASPVARNQALDCVRIWGRVAYVGEGNATTINPSPQMLHKQLSVIGSWVCGLWQLEELGRWMARKGLSFEPMVTHRFPLDEIDHAIGLFDTGKTGKVVIVWP